MTVFRWSCFELVYTPETGETVTHYVDGTTSGAGQPGWAHRYHGSLLDLSPAEAHLHHELAHHLLGDAAPDSPRDGGCIIAWRAAHGINQAPDAEQREWLYTALQYASRGLATALPALEPVRDWGLVPHILCKQHRELFSRARAGVPEVSVPSRKVTPSPQSK